MRVRRAAQVVRGGRARVVVIGEVREAVVTRAVGAGHAVAMAVAAVVEETPSDRRGERIPPLESCPHSCTMGARRFNRAPRFFGFYFAPAVCPS
jgi:hypothetical protein